MTRHLILLRHAKSSWAEPGMRDHERPLNDRGRHDAPHMARRLRKRGWEPEWVLCSDAVRTRQTWELMAEAWTSSPTVVYCPALYLAGCDELAQEIAAVPDDIQTVMAIGHNPGWEESVSWLSGTPTHMTTANAALLKRKSDHWSGALREPGSWALHELLRPKG